MMSRTKEELAVVAAKMHLAMPEDLLPSEITAVICGMLKLRGIRCAKLVIEKCVGAGVVRWSRNQ